MTPHTTMHSRPHWSATVANVGIAIAMIALAWRAIASSSPIAGDTPGPSNTAVPVTDSLWRAVLSEGERLGTDQAKVALVVFTDYQCPACRAFEERTASLQEGDGSSLAALQYRHFPLQRIHPQARTAAALAVCADTRGGFAAMHRALFQRPELVRAEDWHALITSAGLTAEGDSIMACVRGGGAEARLRADSVLAASLQLRGTPTLVTSRQLIAEVPDTATLRRWLTGASAR